MKSNEGISKAGTEYAAITARAVDTAIKQGVEAGTRVAVDFLNEEKKALKKGRFDRRLRNTRLLLQNYRKLKSHVEGAVFDARQAKENAIDILDGIEDTFDDDKLYIESIKRSQERTFIILQHIDKMLQFYQISCEQQCKDHPEGLRRCRIIRGLYIDEVQMSSDELADIECIDKRTLYKDVNAAAKGISSLIFGIDGLGIV